MEGTAIGTPPFMAPEQFVDSAKVDHRADIYSFGVVMYAMATGELPIYPERQPQDEGELSILWARAHHYGQCSRAKFPLFPLVQRCLEKIPRNDFSPSTNFSRHSVNWQTQTSCDCRKSKSPIPRSMMLTLWRCRSQRSAGRTRRSQN